jgi:hypothetical protein
MQYTGVMPSPPSTKRHQNETAMRELRVYWKYYPKVWQKKNDILQQVWLLEVYINKHTHTLLETPGDKVTTRILAVAKQKRTTRSRLKSALRQLWLRSPERAEAMRRDYYTCQIPGCGRKQSRAKGREVYVQSHHIDGIDWDGLVDLIMASGLFCPPERLQTICKEHHKEMK